VTGVGRWISWAIGFTMERDLRIYSRRAAARALARGGCDLHHEVLAKNPGL
jgi:hypothetical protein